MATVVLTIDDEASVSELIRTALHHAGFEVVVAATAAEGIDRALAHRPDLILLDLILPDVDGYSFFDLLEDCGMGHIPVMIVSGCATEEAQGLGRKLGACDYVTKPFGVQDLVDRVHKALVETRGRKQVSPRPRARARAKR